MAQVHRTRDPNIWFNPANYQEAPGEGTLAALLALQAGQTITLLLNGVQTLWARFAGGALALKVADAVARQTWDGIAPGTWVPLVIVQGGAVGLAPVGGHAGASQQCPDRLFDVYIFIDWSATNERSNAPGTDQLWLGELLVGAQPTEEWFPTRWDCACDVEKRLLQHVKCGRRVLVGFDFPYGYPSGFSDAAGLPAPSGKWLAVWAALSALLSDDEQNRSNRFNIAGALNAMMTPHGQAAASGPFWNTPTPLPMLTANSPGFPYVHPVSHSKSGAASGGTGLPGLGIRM